MGDKLISFRDFLTEISGSILSANEWLQSYQAGCFAQQGEAPQAFFQQCAPLTIKQVMVSFSAQAVNRALPDTGPDEADNLFLNFTGAARKQPANLHAKIMFAGDGAPLPPSAAAPVTRTELSY